jgi:hypothetical protein
MLNVALTGYLDGNPMLKPCKELLQSFALILDEAISSSLYETELPQDKAGWTPVNTCIFRLYICPPRCCLTATQTIRTVKADYI